MARPQRESERDVVARPERPGAIRYTTSPAEARRYADLPARRISTRGSAGSGEQEDLTAGTSRLEVAVGVGRGGEGVVVADIGFEDTVAQRGEHLAGDLVVVKRGVALRVGAHGDRRHV